jgi:hypothetical protein
MIPRYLDNLLIVGQSERYEEVNIIHPVSPEGFEDGFVEKELVG